MRASREISCPKGAAKPFEQAEPYTDAAPCPRLDGTLKRE